MLQNDLEHLNHSSLLFLVHIMDYEMFYQLSIRHSDLKHGNFVFQKYVVVRNFSYHHETVS